MFDLFILLMNLEAYFILIWYCKYMQINKIIIVL